MALIEDYGLIGDLETAALVSRDGAIDWLCLPRFDSGALFAALLGSSENGHWTIQPAGEFRSTRRRYRDDTLVLETELETDSGAVRLVDFMPPRETKPDLVRIVEGVRGRVEMRMELVIRFDYGSIVPWVRNLDGTLVAIAGPDAVLLRTPVEHEGRDLRTVASFTVAEGERVPFVLRWFPSNEPPPEPVDPEEALAATIEFWEQLGGDVLVSRTLARRRPPLGAHAEGSDVRADRRHRRRADDLAPGMGRRRPQLGLPLLLAPRRDPHAPRAHPRGLHRGGRCVAGLAPARHRGLAGGSPDHVRRRGRAATHRVRAPVARRLRGVAARSRRERRLRPAPARRLRRGGRRALPARAGTGLVASDGAWRLTQKIFDWLESGWREPDEGIWEVRGPRRHFTHSKVMAWVAFDRAVKTIERFGREGPLERWKAVRKAIRDEVLREGYNADRGAFTQFFGSDRLDASCLLIPLVGFLPAKDERVVGTVRAIEQELLRGGFVERYRADEENADVDGLPPGEGVFLPCSFWLAAVLAQQGRQDDAVALYERLLALRNDLGLISEEYDPERGRLLGNFPQAFTHIGIVETAFTLSGA